MRAVRENGDDLLHVDIFLELPGWTGWLALPIEMCTVTRNDRIDT